MAEIIVPQKTVKITFSLEPAYNVIGSLSLLDMSEDFSGLNEWVYRTTKALSPEQLRRNQLVLQEAYVHLEDGSWSSFPEWVDDLAGLEHIIFIPSAHTGPYLINLGGHSETKVRFLFGARIPEGAPIRLPALNRSELLMRLNALANDTRLLILELLAKKGELGTPDIVAQLELSQSAASRHLEHLTVTGYLTARRHQGTNPTN